MEANTPKTCLVATNFQQQGEARALFSERSGIPVLPQVSDAQQHESGGHLGRDALWGAIAM
jgi:hypothetical protein